MGNIIEVNDTLQITKEQGFPADVLDLANYIKSPVTLDSLNGRRFAFSGKAGARAYHREPVRVFLVQNIAGKWLFWGHAQIQQQTVSKVLDGTGKWTGEWQTRGEYVISSVYEPAYQELVTRRESPAGKSFF
jgi:hypothetical protein